MPEDIGHVVHIDTGIQAHRCERVPQTVRRELRQSGARGEPPESGRDRWGIEGLADLVREDKPGILICGPGRKLLLDLALPVSLERRNRARLERG